MSESQGRRIVIIGGGIIGSTTAYFLSHHPLFNPQKDTITLLEATKIAGGASGKAGGLLGLWAYPDCLVPLSYQLHQDLANKHGGAERWGYRALHCGEIEAQGILATRKPTDDDDDDDDDSNAPHPSDNTRLPKRSPKALSLLRAAGVPPDLDWLAASGLQRYEEMGTPQTTAQVHPYDFTTSMAQLAQEKGVRIVYGSAVAIEQQQQQQEDDDHNTKTAVTGVTYTTRDQASSTPPHPPQHLPADTVILATGPWTPTLHPCTPISSHRAHSITIRPSRPISPYALFTTIHPPDAVSTLPATPEIYPRPNNQVYVCGSTDTLVPLPPSSDLVPCDTSACHALFHHVASVSAPLRDGCVTARQACYLPVVCRTTTTTTTTTAGASSSSSSSSSSSGPLIGPTRVRGLLMGAGHSCWGIQNGPATGKILAEYVFEGEAKSARVGGLDPRNWGV